MTDIDLVTITIKMKKKNFTIASLQTNDVTVGTKEEEKISAFEPPWMFTG